MLLERGAEVDRAERTYGTTPLLIASQKGQVDAVRLLLDKGADVNRAAADGPGTTPLDAASQHGHPAVVRLLLDAQR